MVRGNNLRAVVDQPDHRDSRASLAYLSVSVGARELVKSHRGGVKEDGQKQLRHAIVCDLLLVHCVALTWGVNSRAMVMPLMA